MNKKDVRIMFQLVGAAGEDRMALSMAKLLNRARQVGESKRKVTSLANFDYVTGLKLN